MQSQKLKIPKNLTGDVGKNIKTIDHDFTGEDNNNSNSSSSIGGQSSGRSSFERSSGENLGRHSTISGKKLNAGLLTAENLALLEKRAMKSPKSKKHFSMDEIEEGSEEDHEERGALAAHLTLNDLSLDDGQKKVALRIRRSIEQSREKDRGFI